MIDNLINIPGPIFLIVYLIYGVIVILISKVYVAKDYSLKYEMPEPTKLDPIDIAILKNGVRGAMIISIFNLWRLKAVDISLNKKSVVLKKRIVKTSKLNLLEKTIYGYIQQPKFYRHLFKRTSIKTIERIIQPNKSKLKEYKLIPETSIINHHWKGVLLGTFFLLGLGGLKFYLGLIRDKPVVLLLLLIVLFLIILVVVIKPRNNKTTALGKLLLQKSQQRFEWLKDSEEGSALLKDDNLLYGIAIFGVSSFGDSKLGALIENPSLLDQGSRISSLGYGYGCAGCGGGGCGGGGCSSGGCSSGCSGGCGGGCGGCGGD